MDELDAEPRKTALSGFRAGAGWHGGADVDRLSEQEGRVIADRLLHRVTTKVPSAQEKAAVVVTR